MMIVRSILPVESISSFDVTARFTTSHQTIHPVNLDCHHGLLEPSPPIMHQHISRQSNGYNLHELSPTPPVRIHSALQTDHPGATCFPYLNQYPAHQPFPLPPAFPHDNPLLINHFRSIEEFLPVVGHCPWNLSIPAESCVT